MIVNDFGSLAIDAALLAGVADPVADAGLISLPNGCVCCTVGAGLHEALDALASSRPRPDHVVIEVSGVADPSVAAAWGTVAPFEPAGVIVLADATSIIERSRDRYVGDEVRRQIAGADLVVVTKSDASDDLRLSHVEEWVTSTSGGAPMIRVVDGIVPADVILGVRTVGPTRGRAHDDPHGDRYQSWSWTSVEPVTRAALDRFVGSLPPEVLRVKGRVLLDDGSWVLVQVVGRRTDLARCAPADRSELVAIAIAGSGRDTRPADPAIPNPFVLHFG